MSALGYLTLDRPTPHPLRRRDRTRQSHHLSRNAPCQHPLRPRRRPAIGLPPARYRSSDQHPPAPPQRRQRTVVAGRARKASTSCAPPIRSLTASVPGHMPPPGVANRLPRPLRRNPEGQNLHHRPLPQRQTARDRDSPTPSNLRQLRWVAPRPAANWRARLPA